MKNYIIRLEKEKDFREVENLTREAFWNVYRPGCLEHFVLHCFRNQPNFISDLDFVLEKDGKIVGHVMYAQAEITQNDKKFAIATFGPFSVLPQEQGKGLGETLLRHSLQEAAKLGIKAVAITGNPDYYGKYGFVKGKSVNVFYADDPDADYFLIKELQDGFLNQFENATYSDPKEYFVDESAADEFDKNFPPKIKQKQEGQLA